jgi:hypothetical protein
MVNKPKKPSKMDALMKKLNIDDTYTKPIKYKFPKVKNQVFPQSGYNYEADLLMLPKQKDGINALLTVVDIYSNYLDFEPLKTKSANDVLKAFKTIFSRGILPLPKASIRTDNGLEFKSAVDKYMFDNNILHLWTLPNRHKQNANVENLNGQIGRVIMTYLQNKGLDADWTILLDELRHGLNDLKNHPKDVDLSKYTPKELDLSNDPKYKVGQMVYRRLEKPLNDDGSVMQNTNFRQGDKRFELVPRKIKQVLMYSSPNPYRYILDGFENVSYAEAELIKAKETEVVENWIVSRLLDKKTVKGQLYYLVKWKHLKVKDATWQSKADLIEDGLQDIINDFEQSLKDKAKKKKLKEKAKTKK